MSYYKWSPTVQIRVKQQRSKEDNNRFIWKRQPSLRLGLPIRGKTNKAGKSLRAGLATNSAGALKVYLNGGYLILQWNESFRVCVCVCVMECCAD